MFLTSFSLLLLCSTIGYQDKPNVSERLPRENLLLFRDPSGKTTPVTTTEDWQKRKAEVIRGMESVMGRLPGKEKRCPLEVKVEEEFDGGTYVRKLISYASEPNSRVTAYLCIPNDVLLKKRKASAVLCLHGTNNQIGHGTVVGIGNVTNRGYAMELAQRGYITLSPSYPLLAKYQPDLKALGWESGTLKAVWDNIRGLDYLETLPYLAHNNFGAVGQSLGGHNSVYTAVFDDRIKVIVSSCGLDSYLDYMGGNPKVWELEKGWCQTRYMPKLAGFKDRLEQIPFDFHEMIGSLAPRNTLIISPTMDSNFNADSVDRIAASAAKIYSLYKKPENLKVLHPEGGHDFNPEMREASFKLFDKVLEGK
jgi:hypothetical protein